MVYLILGKQGSGKSTLAEFIAKEKTTYWTYNGERRLHQLRGIELIVCDNIPAIDNDLIEYCNSRHEDILLTSHQVQPDDQSIPPHWLVFNLK